MLYDNFNNHRQVKLIINLAMADFDIDIDIYENIDYQSLKLLTNSIIEINDSFEKSKLLISQNILLSNKIDYKICENKQKKVSFSSIIDIIIIPNTDTDVIQAEYDIWFSEYNNYILNDKLCFYKK